MMSFACGLLLVFLTFNVVYSQTTSYDIIIYGATPAGIAAALSAARVDSSLKILVLEPNYFIGGMSIAGGIGMRDIGNVSSIVNTTMYHWGLKIAQFYNVNNPIFQADSNVMLKTVTEMIEMFPNIEIKINTNLSYVDPVVKAGTTIKAINTLTNGASPEQYDAKVFLDCSYEGDLVKLSGASYTFGRESKSQYNEKYGGVQPYNTFANFDPKFPILATLTANSSQLAPFVDPSPLGPEGSADQRVMSFSYRPCVTQNKTLQTRFYPPPGYNRSDFVILQRFIDTFPNGPTYKDFYDHSGYEGYNNMGKIDMCAAWGALNTDDPTDVNSFMNADYEERQEIIAKVKYFVTGQLWYMAQDDEVPESTRQEFSSYGYCNDQWTENQNFPPQVYIRTGIRLIGDSVLTQNDILAGKFVNNSIALGSWKYDMHIASRTAVKGSDGQLYLNNEGAMFNDVQSENGGITYEVPITVLFPQQSEVTNMIVPVCVSSSYAAFTTLRLEPMYMFLGEGAGIIAAQAVIQSSGQQIIVQNANVTSVQEELSSRGILIHVG